MTLPIKVDSQALDDRQVQLTVEVPPERYNAAMRSAARRLSQRDRIPGFRPGKVPFEVVVGRFGEEAIFDEALDTLGQDVYRQAIEDSQLDPFAPGSLNEVVSREPLVLRYVVPLAPEVDLGNYRKLRLPFKPAEVQDEAVDRVMEDLRQRQAIIEPAGRPVELADVAVVDIQGRLDQPAEGEQAEVLKQEGISLLVDNDTDWPFPGVASQLVGRSAGDELSTQHTFGADYPSEELRSRAATFNFRVREVKSRTVPVWTDELARSLGDYVDLLDLRIKVRKSLAESAAKAAEAEYADQVIGKLVEQAKIQFPPMLTDQEIDDLMHDLVHQLEARELSLEQYLKLEDKTEAQQRDEFRERADRRVRRALVLGKLVELEKLEVGDAPIEERIGQMARTVQDPEGSVRRALSTDSAKRRIRNELLFEQAVTLLVAVAKGEEPTPATVSSAGLTQP
ncbi:MAG: trigger factor [Anaerolineales bacterium]